MPTEPIRALFLDIGGVLLTNGWDRHARGRAASLFDLPYEQLDERHHLTFDTYESGKLTLDEYLKRTVFYEERPFSKEDFTRFIMEQSQPFPDMIELVCQLKRAHGLKLIAVNNEGREINEYRIRQFGLNEFFDAFVSSCYVHLRKPDVDIFRLALDVAQVEPGQAVYIDDRAMFVQEARHLGMHCVHHTTYASTVAAFGALGLQVT
ncbi:HAD family hydrolase [Spirosoma utsteinense]|uniref:Hydrolase of the HAD superfamily n=1 Tax=Spirosoma utsteinense TaxID=2585773 RepID=A0ABR6W358_9BACT|nr:HAD family phosphatase [Spirosoma utsteinense]MBC3784237.1 putative hydrolase of the HAD superfamily [Spirosoma utsteinense]MBC3790965.1 putative hydrolase of the HAD superfamily [Spirosoma utsteinense]